METNRENYIRPESYFPLCPKGKSCSFWFGHSCNQRHTMMDAISIIKRQSQSLEKLRKENDTLQNDVHKLNRKRRHVDILLRDIETVQKSYRKRMKR